MKSRVILRVFVTTATATRKNIGATSPVYCQPFSSKLQSATHGKQRYVLVLFIVGLIACNSRRIGNHAALTAV